MWLPLGLIAFHAGLFFWLRRKISRRWWARSTRQMDYKAFHLTMINIDFNSMYKGELQNIPADAAIHLREARRAYSLMQAVVLGSLCVSFLVMGEISRAFG